MLQNRGPDSNSCADSCWVGRNGLQCANTQAHAAGCLKLAACQQSSHSAFLTNPRFWVVAASMLYAVLECDNFWMCTADDFDAAMVAEDEWHRLPTHQEEKLKAGHDGSLWLRHPQEDYRFKANLMDHADGLRLYMSPRRGLHVVIKEDDAPQLALSLHMSLQGDQLLRQAHTLAGGAWGETVLDATKWVWSQHMKKAFTDVAKRQGANCRLRLVASRSGLILEDVAGPLWVPRRSRFSLKPTRRLRTKMPAGHILLRRLFLPCE